MDEKTDQVSPDKALPDSTEDLKKELQEVEELKKKLVPSKKKDLDAVSGLHGQLEEQHKKKAANPGVPEGKELPKLQEVNMGELLVLLQYDYCVSSLKTEVVWCVFSCLVSEGQMLSSFVYTLLT